MERKKCERCRFNAIRGERFCDVCKIRVYNEMRRAGYLPWGKKERDPEVLSRDDRHECRMLLNGEGRLI